MRDTTTVAVPDVDRLPSASGGISRLAYARAYSAGVDLEPLLRQTGINYRQIEDPRVTIRVRDQIKFLNLVSTALKDDLLGFHLAQTCELREIGLYYYVIASSDTLIDALQRAARYTLILNEGVSQTFTDGKAVGMSFKYTGVSRHTDRQQIEFWITALVRVCRQLTGRHLLTTRVHLSHHRANGSEMSEFFGSKVEFNRAKDDIQFPRNTRELPVVSADPYLNKLLVSYCEEAMARRTRNRESFRSSVENVIVPLLPHGKAHVAEIARQLGIGQRTFARRLSMEGLTFSALLEKLRADLADRYLADGDLTISQIAWLLGYRDLASFSNAFKRWAGKTPREWRSSLAVSEPKTYPQ
jgi:AraC-like DNA-binding protein